MARALQPPFAAFAATVGASGARSAREAELRSAKFCRAYGIVIIVGGVVVMAVDRRVSSPGAFWVCLGVLNLATSARLLRRARQTGPA